MDWRPRTSTQPPAWAPLQVLPALLPPQSLPLHELVMDNAVRWVLKKAKQLGPFNLAPPRLPRRCLRVSRGHQRAGAPSRNLHPSEFLLIHVCQSHEPVQVMLFLFERHVNHHKRSKQTFADRDLRVPDNGFMQPQFAGVDHSSGERHRSSARMRDAGASTHVARVRSCVNDAQRAAPRKLRGGATGLCLRRPGLPRRSSSRSRGGPVVQTGATRATFSTASSSA